MRSYPHELIEIKIDGVNLLAKLKEPQDKEHSAGKNWQPDFLAASDEEIEPELEGKRLCLAHPKFPN